MENQKDGASFGMEENLKKAVTEMLILAQLEREDMYSFQITKNLETGTGGALSIVFPYAALYRLIDSGYITEAYKKIAPDGRRRQYFQITDLGRARVAELKEHYRRFTQGVMALLSERGGEE